MCEMVQRKEGASVVLGGWVWEIGSSSAVLLEISCGNFT